MPVHKDECEWFRQYVFPSSVWVMRNQRNEFLFEDMLKITASMSEKVDNSMDAIFEHLEAHREWNSLCAIDNKVVVARQDDDRVGLLRENGIADMKDDSDLSTFIDHQRRVSEQNQHIYEPLRRLRAMSKRARKRLNDDEVAGLGALLGEFQHAGAAPDRLQRPDEVH